VNAAAEEELRAIAFDSQKLKTKAKKKKN